ncbi:MAG: hypothetical protein HXX16_13985 [Bacteroidales bacterium]|nr:hypothetical protein [Bacteroidales bacterium]
MKKLTILLILIYATSVAQAVKQPTDSLNKSQINGVQGNNNNITVIQGNNNTIGNNNKVAQDSKNDSTASTPKPGGFQEWISNTNNLFILLGSIAAFIASVWAGIQTLKKIRKRK